MIFSVIYMYIYVEHIILGFLCDPYFCGLKPMVFEKYIIEYAYIL